MAAKEAVQTHRVDGNRIQARAQQFELEAQAPGDKHMWIFTTSYRLSEENAEKAANGEVIHLDNENLVMAGGPICWRCEAPVFNKYPCPGYRRVVMSQLVEGSGG